MEFIERMWGMLRRGTESLAELWPIKVLASMISTAFCFLFGGSEVIFAVVIVLIALDTVTKWAAITKRWLLDHGHQNETLTVTSMVFGFWYAWAPGYLTSTDLRRHWGEKLFTYAVLVIAAGVITKLPEIVLFGTPVNKSLAGGIYTCIAMTELFSITENFEEMGNKKLAQLKQFLCTLANKVTGGNFTVTISSKEVKKDG